MPERKIDHKALEMQIKMNCAYLKKTYNSNKSDFILITNNPDVLAAYEKIKFNP